MKNIERKEVQGVAISMMLGKIKPYDGLKEFEKLGFKTKVYSFSGDLYPYMYSELMTWFNSEYVEPHRWEPWELEAMKHINKCFDEIVRQNGNAWIHKSKNNDFHLNLIDFPSLKFGETINIDEELERNGLHR
jgi:hypothetical protein